MSCSLLVTLLLTTLGDSTRVPGRDRAIAQFHHTAWTAKDGAPSQIIALAQTKDGYLWIGTARGLFRFDGVRFERYADPAGVELPSHNIGALLATADGGLWISARYGLGFLKDGRLTAFSQPDDLPEGGVFVFAADLDGRVWAGTVAGLAVRSGSRWLEVGSDWNVGRGPVNSLMVDRQGTLWARVKGKIWYLPRGSRRFEDGGIKAGSPDGIIRWAERLGVGADKILLDRDGALWAVGGAPGLVRVRFPERAARAALIERYGERDGLSGDYPFALLEDIEGTIWVGTNKGLDRFRHSNVVPVRLPADVGEVTLLAGENGAVWVGSTTGNVLLHIRGLQVIAHRAPSASSVFRALSGAVWWGGYGAIWRRRGARIDSFPLPPDIPTDWILELIRSDDHDAQWVRVLGTPGLLHFKHGVWSRPPPPAGLLPRGPTATYHDAEGRIWVGYPAGRVDVLKDGRISSVSRSDGVDIGTIKVIRGGGPEFWLGGESGLAVALNGQVRSVITDGGEPFETVSGIIVAADGALWLNELRGIVRIAPAEARRIITDPNHRARYQLLKYSDGLPGAPQMNFTVATAVEATDGRLWFATDNGLASIDPANFRTNPIAPPVSIVSPAPGSRFPAGTESIQLRYTALSLAMPEQVLFRYRLDGVDQQWQEAGARREATYTNLRPGQYTFRVTAANHDGIWNETGATVTFEIPAAFTQTAWFKTLAVLLAAGLLWMAYLLRLRQMAARMQRLHVERLDERTRIASELHDTLLQGFTGVTLEIQGVLQRKRAHTPRDDADLSRVLQLADATLREARERIWDLRAPMLDGHDFPAALDAATRRALGGTPIDLRFAVRGDRRPLAPEIETAALRIACEAVTNARKHAAPRFLDVELRYEPAALELSVRDDGAGFVPDYAEDAGGRGHWGVVGMRERASRVGGTIEITSGPGHGTSVIVRLPAAPARTSL